MSKTNRIWHKPKFRFRMKLEEGGMCQICGRHHGNYHIDPWKLDSMSVFYHKKRKWLRKEMRHTIRCQNRTRFAHGLFEPYKHAKIDYFD